MAKINTPPNTSPKPPEGEKAGKTRQYRCRWQVLRDGVTYEEGDEIELTEKEAASIGEVLEAL